MLVEMRHARVLLGLTAVLATAAAARAVHPVRIDEVMAGANGDAGISFIELEFAAGTIPLWGPQGSSWIRVAQPCDDAVDNDSDTFVDFPNDPGCSHAQDRTEGPDCNDGLDNDGDGLIDAGNDPSCDDALDLSERSSLLVCNDGVDQDGRGGFRLSPRSGNQHRSACRVGFDL